jgi:hypothetical protein
LAHNTTGFSTTARRSGDSSLIRTKRRCGAERMVGGSGARRADALAAAIAGQMQRRRSGGNPSLALRGVRRRAAAGNPEGGERKGRTWSAGREGHEKGREREPALPRREREPEKIGALGFSPMGALATRGKDTCAPPLACVGGPCRRSAAPPVAHAGGSREVETGRERPSEQWRGSSPAAPSTTERRRMGTGVDGGALKGPLPGRAPPWATWGLVGARGGEAARGRRRMGRGVGDVGIGGALARRRAERAFTTHG